MTTQKEERDFLRTLEGPKGSATVYQVTPAGMGQGEVQYEVDFGGQKQLYPSIGEAMVNAEELTGARS